MKIMKRIDFLKLPANTVFSTYEPCCFGPLLIKGDTISAGGKDIDFGEQQIADAVAADHCGEYVDTLFRSQETGESFNMDFDCLGRDGMFEPDARLFAVWEEADVRQLIERLHRCLPTSV